MGQANPVGSQDLFTTSHEDEVNLALRLTSSEHGNPGSKSGRGGTIDPYSVRMLKDEVISCFQWSRGKKWNCKPCYQVSHFVLYAGLSAADTNITAGQRSERLSL